MSFIINLLLFIVILGVIVFVHEFGHCAGLDHRSGEKSIMNPTNWGNDSRYEYWGVVVPQTKDINSVNYYY